MSEHYEGIGCICGAWASIECGCSNADWRSVKEVKLEAENKQLKKQLEEQAAYGEYLIDSQYGYLSALEAAYAQEEITPLQENETPTSKRCKQGYLLNNIKSIRYGLERRPSPQLVAQFKADAIREAVKKTANIVSDVDGGLEVDVDDLLEYADQLIKDGDK